MAKCIWCKGPGALSREHIIPEALGCPDGFVLLNGTVCQSCNNRLGHLDQAVIDDFDIIAYMNGVPRKKGRPPEVRNRGNLIGTSGRRGNEISINMERHPVKGHDGSRLAAFGGSNRNIRASFEGDGNVGKVSFSTQIGQSAKFVRGIVKIAFSSLAYFLGSDAALADEFDPVRTFVRDGTGRRLILLMESKSEGYHNRVWPPYRSESGDYAVTFRLAIIEFCVDLSPELRLFPLLKEQAIQMYGESGWTYLPTDT